MTDCTRISTILTIALLGSMPVACDADSPDEPVLLMASDVIDREDAEALASENEELQPLVDAVELTADSDPSALWEAEIIDYCFDIDPYHGWSMAGQCTGYNPMIISGMCVVIDPYHVAFGHAIVC